MLLEFADRGPVGCYWTDAMIVFVECRGYQGSGSIEYVLNLPLFLFYYAPMFAMLSWQEYPAMLLSPFYLYVVWLVVGLMFPFFLLARIWQRATLRD